MQKMTISEQKINTEITINNFMKYFEYSLFNSSFENLFEKKFSLNKPVIISTINPHSFVVAENDEVFKSSLINSNFLIVDGIGIKLILYLFFKNVKLLNGPKLHSHILNYFKEQELRVFYMGSTEDVLTKIKQKLKKEVPLWIIETYSPPFVSTFSTIQNNLILEKINKFKPDILFVGMTAPKQEKWVDFNKSSINSKYIISIGAVFDFYSEIKKSPPQIIEKLNLIWLHRLMTDFNHVWKRTLISFPLFICYNIKKSIKS